MCLKKSLVKDRNGIPLLPPEASSSCLPQPLLSEITVLAVTNQKLKTDFMILKNNYDTCVEALKTIDSLQIKLTAEKVNIKTEPNDEDLHNLLLEKNHFVDCLEFEIKQLDQKIVDDKSTIVNHKVELQNIHQEAKTNFR